MSERLDDLLWGCRHDEGVASSMTMSVEKSPGFGSQPCEQARKDLDVQRLQVALAHSCDCAEDAGLDGVGGVVVGIDMGVALKLAEVLGFDVSAVAGLLPDAEAGLLEGLIQLREENEPT